MLKIGSGQGTEQGYMEIQGTVVCSALLSLLKKYYIIFQNKTIKIKNYVEPTL